MTVHVNVTIVGVLKIWVTFLFLISLLECILKALKLSEI